MSKIIVYLDNCCYNRPYDDQGQLSIYLETQAKLAIQELVKDKDIICTSSHKLLENAKEFVLLGLGIKDALHLASAIDSKCDYFITVDKGILRKTKGLDDIVTCSPISFIDYLEEEK